MSRSWSPMIYVPCGMEQGSGSSNVDTNVLKRLTKRLFGDDSGTIFFVRHILQALRPAQVVFLLPCNRRYKALLLFSGRRKYQNLTTLRGLPYFSNSLLFNNESIGWAMNI